MSAFSIGQRVRVAWVYWPENNHLVGLEGVVIEMCEGDPNRIYGLDVAPIEEVAPGVRCGFYADQLEPATPPGLESVEEIDALYEPSGVTA